MRPFDLRTPLPPGTTLIEASAGTGKTYSLTYLCLRLVVELGVPVERVLLVTFTRAATAELRDRLRDRFVTALEVARRALGGEAPEGSIDQHLFWQGDRPRADLDTRIAALERAVREVDAASVFTIHSFCQRVLKEHALSCGADLTAELTEDTRKIVDRAARDEHTALRYAADTAELALLDQAGLSWRNLGSLARTVTSDPLAPIDPPPQPTRDVESLVAPVAARWRAEGAAAIAWVTATRDAGILNAGSFKAASMQGWADRLDAWAAEQGARLDTEAVSRLAPETLRAKVRKGKSLPDPIPGVLHDLVALEGALAALADQRVVGVAHRLRERYARALDSDSLVSFDRLIRDVADQVQQPALRRVLRERYDAALIDEFQDTDAAQWAIFSTVFGDSPDHRLILVGDPKQAIYGFRGADIRVYGAARAQTDPARRLTMTVNHRSDGPLVAALNALFATPGDDPDALDAFSEHFIRYEPVDVPDRHRAPRLALGPDRSPVEIRWFDGATFGGAAGTLKTSGPARDALPALVTAEARALLDAAPSLTTADGERPVQPGDLAVLVLTNSDATRIREALVRAGIPAVIQQGQAVTSSRAAGWMRDWLHALAQPSADAPVRRLTVSPLLGWTLPELHAALHAERPQAQAQERWVATVDRIAAQADAFRRWGFLAAWQGLLDGGALDRVAALPDGERSLADLAHLAELLHAAAARHRDPLALATWLAAQQIDSEHDAETLAQRLETDSQAVQVVTIHKSKGLQYPIVFAPDLWRKTSLRDDARRATPFDATVDGGPPRTGLDVSTDAARPPKSQRIDAYERELRRERVRLLYVALTRAMHHLVVWGGDTKDLSQSPLGALLAARAGVDGAPVDRADGFTRTLDGINQALGPALAHGVTVRAAEPPPRLRRPAPSAPPALPAPARYARGAPSRAWRRLSFTALTRRAAHAGPTDPVADYDEVDAVAGEAPVLLDEVALSRFPRGREAGIFVHGVLEVLDFQTGAPRADAGASTTAALLETLGRRLGFTDPAALDQLAAALPSILATSLGPALGDAALRDLPLGDRLDELEFDLPVRGGFSWQPARGGLTGAAIARVLRGAAPDMPGFEPWLDRLAELQPDAVAGFLTGSVDLVARVHTPDGPRYFLADYKTNRLATPAPDDAAGRSTPADYAPDRLAAAMAEHHYFLQASLYLVGLHRYLRHRIGPSYTYERAILGAGYLFVRGMSGAPGAGVLSFCPRPDAIRALSALIDGGAP